MLAMMEIGAVAKVKKRASVVGLGAAVGDKHAQQDADGAGEEVGSNLLAQHPRGENHGGDGVEVYPVGGFHRAQLGDAPVPGEKANHRRQTAQECQVAHYHGLGEYGGGGERGVEYIIR